MSNYEYAKNFWEQRPVTATFLPYLMRLSALGIFAFCVAWPRLGAQIITPPAAGPNTIVGVVVDTSNVPLAGVTVVLRTLGRETTTRQNGTFRFDSVKTGTHEISARGVGLIVGVQRVKVDDKGASVRITMIRFGTALASVITTATRGGLSGVIADTAFQPLSNVVIRPVGGSGSATTDSLGAFFMPLKPGQYLLRVEKDGYMRQTLGVTIPELEGREIAAWLKPQVGPKNNVMGQELFELNSRMMRVSRVSSKFLSRGDLVDRGIIDMQALALQYGTGRITPECMVTIGGMFNRKVPLGNLTTSDVEFVEVYLPTMTGRSRGKARGSLTSQPAASGYCGNVTLIAWLRN